MAAIETNSKSILIRMKSSFLFYSLVCIKREAAQVEVSFPDATYLHQYKQTGIWRAG